VPVATRAYAVPVFFTTESTENTEIRSKRLKSLKIFS